MRIAVVDQDRCQPKKCNYECINFCPVWRQGVKEVIQPKGPAGKAVISEDLCIGCGICVNKCPFDAITIVNLPERLNSDLIHRYGENQFALFRLPVPRAGEVVGLLGPNGIGKSTAIRILSGTQVPNLGAHENKDPSWQPVLDRYRGTELGDYLERAAAGTVKTVTKPQYVDKLPKAVKGIVRDLLTRADERGEMQNITRDLSLDHLLDRELTQLSGGELQRTAIAAVLGREADVYFIDEPSSYLDINQRLRIARLIRELADNHGKAVVVIEHDLAALDFLADQVHVMYGQEGAYGVIALPRPVRTGINTYLKGMLKEENVRFRDTEIEFTLHPPRHEWTGTPVASFPELRKTLGGFDLSTGAGDIKQGEVVGVVGPNGIGKTTFVKLLAGVEKPDQGKIDREVRVAYKPQYVKSDYEDTVQNLFYETLGSKYTTSMFANEVAVPLDLARLEHKVVTTLSGGELQRVALAICLAQEADLYLLDEPSAYLDVDQRMIAARVIRRAMERGGRSALVVDHDVYFLDVLADSIMVFDGEPGKRGVGAGPFDLREGMNRFLSSVNVTFRRDKETLRPRVNKPGSRLDREQREIGEYYYMAAND